mmetsp:Transcript_41765/g.121031  ORF Transcript_41765/g.121031 Transcript_41765/m.121031 type:complete len:403 (-) Transcript_41765:95-1303(-)
MYGTPVEVRKNPSSTTWYDATILDVLGTNIKIGFEDNVWRSREVPSYSVRRRPQDDYSDGFTPEIGDVVEVLVPASDSNPRGWSLGRVKAIKKSFFFVAFMGSQKAVRDLIVERESIRPVNTEPSIDTTGMVRRQVSADPELHRWMQSEDCAGCLSSVQSRCRLLLAAALEPEPELGGGEEPEIVLVGSDRDVELAAKLLEMIHLKYYVDIVRHPRQISQLQERLAQLRRRCLNRHRATFTQPPPGSLPRIRAQIRAQTLASLPRVRREHGVDVQLEESGPEPGAGPPVTQVSIEGPSEAAVQRAREELEVVTRRMAVTAEEAACILGKSFQTIKQIGRDTNLQCMRFDDQTYSLELCGLREQIDQALKRISQECSYLAVRESRSEENAVNWRGSDDDAQKE